MSCVPLVVVSADRPAELQGLGVNQTINQEGLYGAKVRRYSGIEAPDPDEDANLLWRRTVAALVSSATAARPGPVHLNVRFREPTVPVSDDGRTATDPYRFATPRIDRLPRVEPAREDDPGVGIVVERGLVIAGDGDYDRAALVDHAGRLGWPILATALSGLRGGSVVGAYHHLLSTRIPDELRPESVVAVGAIGPSPSLEELFASARQRIRIDRWGRGIDPGGNATHVLTGSVIRLLGEVSGSASAEWHDAWISADRKLRARMNETLAAADVMSGPGVASALNEVDWECLVVASSLPIRDVDAHLDRPGTVIANRGASGIDGFVSSALGVAGTRPRTLALAGDLSLFHDSNGFLHDAQVDLTLVVVDNGGGGIFDSLPPARFAPDYERLFVTNPGRSIESLARFHGLRFTEAGDREALQRLATEALARPGLDLIRVEVDRADDLAVRSQLEG